MFECFKIKFLIDKKTTMIYYFIKLLKNPYQIYTNKHKTNNS